MSGLDALAACSRAVDRAICAALEHKQRQEARERRARFEGPGARRRPDRVGLRWRLEVLRQRAVRLLERVGLRR